MGTNQSVVDPASALVAYEPLAAYYDDLTAGYGHDRWVSALAGVLTARGLRGRTLLDVACGTGKSTLPWAERGYAVSACDVSPAMVARARQRLGPGAEVFIADMRALPGSRRYDLVTCLDDSINYLLNDADLRRAFASMALALRPDGVLLFDCNSFLIYRERFCDSWESEVGAHRFRWQGMPEGELEPGARFSAKLEVLSSGREGVPLASTVHRQRHHPPPSVRRALAATGLSLLAVFGQSTGAQLSPWADERRHPKLVYLAQLAADDRKESK